MKKIPLSQGKFALVDDEDFKWLNQWKWSLGISGYAVGSAGFKGTKRKTKKFLMHRIILDAPRDRVVDHLDHDKLNNQKNNLRLCTQFENMLNRKDISKNNKSGIVGVSFDKARNRWRATFSRLGKNTFIGRYDSKEEAAMAVVNYQPKQK